MRFMNWYFDFSSILDAYRTGRGRVVVRGKTEVEALDSKRTAIIIKEVSNSFFLLGQFIK